MVNNAFTGLEDPAIVRAADAFEEAHPGVGPFPLRDFPATS